MAESDDAFTRHFDFNPDGDGAVRLRVIRAI